MDFLAAICAGVALAAACGLRVFLPLFGLACASAFGLMSAPPGMQWLDSATAVVLFGVATAVEIGAYYVPWLDHLLDTIMSPGSVVAGSVAVAAMIPDLHPAVRWSLAIVAGGGAAGIVQIGSVITRALSGAATAGLGNPVVSTVEWIGSLVLTILALIVPLLAAIFVPILFVWIARAIWRWLHSTPPPIAVNDPPIDCF